MHFYNPYKIGILACPGGANFAGEVVAHLKSIAKKQFKKRVKELSKKYEMPEDAVAKQLSFQKDMNSSNIGNSRDFGNQQIPRFEIKANFYRFANGEFKTEILSSIRGMDVYIVQDVSNEVPLPSFKSQENVVNSVNDHIFCLLVTADAALQAGAGRVTLVLPTYPYSRQHRKKSREGLTAARFGRMVESFGIERIITLDIHSKEIENSFNLLRLENLRASYQITRVLREIVDLHDPDLVILAPDTGAVERNKFFARSLGRPLGMIYKERDYSQLTHDAAENNITNMTLLGSVKGKTVFITDDMLGTGGTLIKAIRFLKEEGAEKIICAVSLPLFNGKAIEHFDQAYKDGLFYRIIGTNAVQHNHNLASKEWFLSANVSKLFARAIYRLHHNQSLSTILDNREIIERLMRNS